MEEISIKIGGILSATVGIGHCFFYRLFGWKQEFGKITLLSSKVLYTIHVFVIPLLLFFAYVSLVHTKELTGGSPLGTAMIAFYSAFWLVRGIWQIFYFKLSRLDDFKRFFPLHYFLVGQFFLMCVLYAVPLFAKMGNAP